MRNLYSLVAISDLALARSDLVHKTLVDKHPLYIPTMYIDVCVHGEISIEIRVYAKDFPVVKESVFHQKIIII